jgi:SpoVK/Ycf46/Vps4 family AAA+-type ATPase
MAVNRIQQLDIDRRPLFTGIFGSSGTSEYFIEKDLCKYTLQQELYLYLRELGYLVIFYNNHNNFSSIEEDQLAIFWRLKEEPSVQQPKTPSSTSSKNKAIDDIFGKIQTPFKASRATNQELSVPVREPLTQNDNERSHFVEISVAYSQELGSIYRIANDENVFDRILKFSDDNPHRKVAVIITNPDTLSFDKVSTDLYISRLRDYIGAYKKNDLKLKIIALYPEQTEGKFNEDMDSYNSAFFYHQTFKNILFPQDNQRKNSSAMSSSLFFLSAPDEEEVGYWLNRRRIMDNLEGMFLPLSFKKIRHLLWQDMSINDNKSSNNMKIRHDFIFERDSLSSVQIKEYIDGLSTETAWDRLNALSGIDNVRSQFEDYIEDLHRSRQNNIKFLPHMVLEGNPGTGKTTLAKLFAEILHEEGVLPRGHVVEATVADLEGEYVGSTRIKTQELCQRAKGGVLFIDEAYGLYDYSGQGEHGGYGKEAVEVLIQHMSNNTDSVVILAGYQMEMEDMLNKVNPGLKRRLNKKYGTFLLEDYLPETLLEISKKSIQKKGFSMSPQCQKQLLQVLTRMYQMRDKSWGNAGEADQMASIIYNNHCRRHPDNPQNYPIESESFEEAWIKMISNELHEDTDILRELDLLIGMDNVKQEIKEFLLSVKSQRDEMELRGDNFKMDIPLNFIIMGNPGTGKTTLAGILARILKNYGVLSSADVTPVTKDQLVSPLAGQGGKNVNDIMDGRINGVLFIDEAYQLAEPDAKDAVTTLVNNLTNPKYEGKLLVILAGYYREMQSFIESNAGISRRFGKQIIIGDYSDEELWQILLNKAKDKKDWNITNDCKSLALNWFSNKRKNNNRFGNAGECDLLINEIDRGHNRRIYSLPIEERNDLTVRHEILPGDFPNYNEII